MIPEKDRLNKAREISGTVGRGAGRVLGIYDTAEDFWKWGIRTVGIAGIYAGSSWVVDTAPLGLGPDTLEKIDTFRKVTLGVTVGWGTVPIYNLFDRYLSLSGFIRGGIRSGHRLFRRN